MKTMGKEREDVVGEMKDNQQGSSTAEAGEEGRALLGSGHNTSKGLGSDGHVKGAFAGDCFSKYTFIRGSPDFC